MSDNEENSPKERDDSSNASRVNVTGHETVEAQPATKKLALFAANIKRSYEHASSDKLADLDYARSKIRYGLLLQTWKDYLELYMEVTGKMDDDVAERLQAQFVDTQEQYIEASALLSSHMESKRVPTNPDDGASVSAVGLESGKQPVTLNVKMAVQDIKNTWGYFDGSYVKWKGFHDRFVAEIHNNDEVKPATKFSKLKGSLTGKAAQAFGEWELNEASYADAWDRLNKLYDRKYLVCTEHIHQLLALPVLHQPATSAELQRMANTAHEQIRSLRAHGIPVDKWDMMICVLLHDRLQNETGRQWELTRSSETPTATEMLDFLDKQAASLANVGGQTSRAPIRITVTNERAQQNMERGKSTTSASGGAIPKHYPCEWCHEDHMLYDCREFLALNLAGRSDFIRKRNLCPNCFKRGHGKENCFSSKCPDARCARDPAHNSRLCPQKQGAPKTTMTASQPEPSWYRGPRDSD